MSLIDKILGGLKKRKADAPPPPPAAAVVANVAKTPKKRVSTALLAALVVVLAGGVGWLWWSSHHQLAVPVKVVQAPAKPISAPQAVPSSTVMPSAASGGEIAIATSSPVAVATLETLPKEKAPHENGHDMEVAALEPSPEAESKKPASVRTKPLGATKKLKQHKFPPFSGTETVGEASAVESSLAPVPEGGVDKQVKPLTVQQQADNEFRKANGLLQQGRVDEAQAGYESALQLDAGHDAARQALAVLLLENKRNSDAERLLQEGLKHNVKHSGFAMLLARIQLERDASWSALLTLQKTLPYAERKADYRAFVAALLQRLDRHREAVTHFQAAVQLSPNSGVWWMGLGISLQALKRNEEARTAFKRALDTNTLNVDLQAFVAQQLREL